MREMLNIMRLQALQAMGERACTRLGLISSYDPANYAVRVAIQPEGNLTGWIPLLSPWVGNGWGMFCPPTIGDMVEVQFQEADHDAALSCMRVFNDQNRPLTVPSGEFWLVHKSGSLLKFHNDGSIEVTASAGITYTATSHAFKGPVTMDQTLIVTQDISDKNGAKGTVQHIRDNYDAHTHSGVQTGGGSTGTPSNSL
jgi:uncharacterized protein involved in type VI secretion and phage assembly